MIPSEPLREMLKRKTLLKDMVVRKDTEMQGNTELLQPTPVRNEKKQKRVDIVETKLQEYTTIKEWNKNAWSRTLEGATIMDISQF